MESVLAISLCPSHQKRKKMSDLQLCPLHPPLQSLKHTGQRMRLQSWLYEICILSVSYNYDFLKYKLLSFIAKSLNKPFKNHIRGRIFIFNLKSLYLKSFSFILSWWTRIKSPGCIFTCITISSGDGFGLIKDTLRFPK